MAITTAPAIFRSGTLSFSIGTANVGMVEVSDISELSYDFDLKQAQSAINSIGIMPGSMTVSLWDNTSSGKSLYTILLGEIGTYSVSPPTLDVTMSFTPYGASASNSFPFQLQFSGVKTDYKTGITQVLLLPPLQSDETYRSRYSNLGNTIAGFDYATNIYHVNVRATEGVTVTNYDGFLAGLFLEDYIRRLDPTAVSNVFNSGYDSVAMSPAKFSPPGYYGTKTAFVFTNIETGNISAVPLSLSNVPVRAKVFSATAMEGAIIGSAWSVNFYVNRMTNTINKTLSNSDISDLSFVKNGREVNAINIYINTGNIPTSPSPTQIMFPTGQYEAGYFLAPQFIGLDLQSHAPQMGRGTDEGDNGDRNVVNTDSTAATMNINVQGLARAGAVAYSFAFGSYQGQAVEKIETTVQGVNRVLPHEVIKFDSSTPIDARNKHFRPSSLKYNFKDDTIKVTAYQIP